MCRGGGIFPALKNKDPSVEQITLTPRSWMFDDTGKVRESTWREYGMEDPKGGRSGLD